MVKWQLLHLRVVIILIWPDLMKRLPRLTIPMLLKLGGMTGPLDMGGNKITDVASPVNDGDAANKGYVDKKPNIIVGSYTGTGKDGVNNPNTITFPFVPTIVFIYPAVEAVDSYSTYYGILLPTIGRWGSRSSSLTLAVNKKTISISNTTVSWYGNDSSGQMNNVCTYYYVAIG